MKIKALLKLLISKDYVVILGDEAFLNNEHKLISQISTVLDRLEVE